MSSSASVWPISKHHGSNSTADVANDIPNRTRFQSLALLDTDGSLLSEQLVPTSTTGAFSFLNLEDEQDSWGGQVSLPLDLDRMGLTLTGGWWASQKSRSYLQYKVNLNAVGIPSALLSGTPYDVLSSGDVTVDNGFDLTVVAQSQRKLSRRAEGRCWLRHGRHGVRSVAFHGRRPLEAYDQAVLAFDPLDYGQSIVSLTEQLLDPINVLPYRKTTSIRPWP